jgi:hypothetical protein
MKSRGPVGGSRTMSGEMWIPSHAEVMGNKRADQLAGDAVENGIEWHATVCPSDFLALTRTRLLEGWQSGRVILEDMLTLFGL